MIRPVIEDKVSSPDHPEHRGVSPGSADRLAHSWTNLRNVASESL